MQAKELKQRIAKLEKVMADSFILNRLGNFANKVKDALEDYKNFLKEGIHAQEEASHAESLEKQFNLNYIKTYQHIRKALPSMASDEPVTAMPTSSVVENFFKHEKGTGSNLFTDGTVLRHYKTALAQWDGDTLILNITNYSPSTRKVQNQLERLASGIKSVKEVNDIKQDTWVLAAAFTPKDHDPYYDISSALDLNTGTKLKKLKDLLNKQKVRSNPDTYQLMLDLPLAKAKEIVNWITKNNLKFKKLRV